MIAADPRRRSRTAALVLLAAVLAAAPARADGPPLVAKGELTATDPLDRMQKHSHAKAHAVELKAGQAILVHLRSIDFDPMLRVEDDRGSVLGSNDDIVAGVQTSSRLGFVAPAAGTYRLVVTSFDPDRTGEYLLEVAALERAGEPAALDGKITDESPAVEGKRYQTHRLETEAGRWYLFDLAGTGFAPVLVLRDGQGKTLAEDQGGGVGPNARLVWPCEVAAPWVVQVLSPRPGAAGSYRLTYRTYRGTLTAGPTEREILRAQAAQLHRRAVASYRQGNFDQGAALVREALAISQKLWPAARYPQGHPDLAVSLSNLGALLDSAGHYEEARGYYEQALAMYQKLFPAARYPQGHPDLAISLNSLGTLLRLEGRYEEAQGYFEQALAMRQKLFPAARYPQGHPDLATSLNNLAALLQSAGRYEEAQGYFEQALAMYQKLFRAAHYPQGHPDLATSLNNLGALLQSAGRYEEARGYYEQALAMYQKLYPATRYPQGHPDLARNLNNLGALLQSAGRYEEARGYHEQALAMYQKLFPAARYPQGHPDLARSLNSLGMLLDSAGRYEEARGYCEQALAMRQKLFPAARYPQGHPDLARSVNNLGVLLKSKGRYEEAQGYFEQALVMYQKLFPAARYPQGHPDLATSLSNLGALLHLAGRHAEALTHLRPAAKMYLALTLREISSAPEAQALDWLAQVPRTGDVYLSAAQLAGSPAEATYAELWPRKALVTRLLQRRHQAARAARAADPAVRRAWDDFALARGQLNRLLTEPIRDAAAHAAEVTRLTARKEALERDLAALLPELERARVLDRLGPADLAGLLPEGVAFVDLLRYTHFGTGKEQTAGYVAFVVWPDRTTRLVELKDAAPIDKAVRGWRDRIATYRDTPEDARAAAALVWDPIAKALPPNLKGLYLAPDGALAELPWAALPGKKAGTVLLEDLAIAVVPHGPFLLEQLKYPPQDAPGPDAVVAVGAVDYGATDPAAYAPLPGTAVELVKLSEAAGKRPVTLLAKDQARWDLLRDRLPGARYAHLATHGFYDAKALALEKQRLEAVMKVWQSGPDAVRRGHGARSPLAFTGLALAGANWPGKGGIVTGEALVELPLEGMRLCVLSACESGLGDLGPLTGEGVQGLPRALHLAGCANVVSSLWNVEDRATAALMGKFYDELWRKGRPPLEALREAQLLVYRHPELVSTLSRSGPTALKTLAVPPGPTSKTAPTKLWAGFILSGVGR